MVCELTSALPLPDSKFGATLVGFENHGGRTYLGNGARSLAKVTKGYGNNGEDKTEGIVYKNSIGTYLHGPILAKNPHIADYLIAQATGVKLESLQPEDTFALNAHTACKSLKQ